MLKIKKNQLTKKEISKIIHLETGTSKAYTSEITDDLIYILKDFIKIKNLNIKNFGSFKIVNKKERIGRNPKNRANFVIKARRTLIFKSSKSLNTKINR
jgi:Bacterial nucleoid DNA-binding protein